MDDGDIDLVVTWMMGQGVLNTSFSTSTRKVAVCIRSLKCFTLIVMAGHMVLFPMPSCSEMGVEGILVYFIPEMFCPPHTGEHILQCQWHKEC